MSASSEIPSDNVTQSSLLATRVDELEQVGLEKIVNRCDTCRRTFNTARGLNQHLRIGKCQDGVHISSSETDSSRENHSSVFSETVSHDSIWGSLNLDEVNHIITSIYEECVFWRRNLFLLPSGKSGKQFIEECTRLINDWTNDAPLKPIALKALMIMPSLLLQKTSKNSKAKDHSEQLSRRIESWKAGEFDKLTREVRFIQSRLKSHASSGTIDQLAKRFNDLMLAGKVNAALRLLSNSDSCGILPINENTKHLLTEKHPSADEQHEELMLEGPEFRFDEYAYEDISGSFICKITREVKSASGPLSLVDGWKRILTSSSFCIYCNNLCDSIAALARKLCFSRNCTNDYSLEALLASKLIPLDTNPGLRPIGVAEF